MIQKNKEYTKKNYAKVRKYYTKYFADKRKNDSDFAIKERVRRSVLMAFKKYSDNGKKLKSSIKYGIDYQAIINHLGKFPSKNRGEWHIHHIKPVSLFNFNNPEEIKEAYAPSNLMWLDAKENIRLGNRINL